MTLLRSWVDSANSASTGFPLNNLPCGVFSAGGGKPRCGVAVGDMIADVAGLEAAGVFRIADEPVFDMPSWNGLMDRGPAAWSAFRARMTALLAAGSEDRPRAGPFMVPAAGATLHLPLRVSEYTDFYASRHHAANVGSLFRDPAHALPPNWLHMPVGYNGRASSVVVSGTPVRRPWGQIRPDDTASPVFAPSRRFDFELELGAVVGTASQGMVSVAEADRMIFGYVLLNDWSARDIQAWEYQPLGPFQSKATATSISPWIVMAAALGAFRVDAPPREVALLDYLREPGPMLYDIGLAVTLAPADGHEAVIARTNARELYYSPAQQLCHHTTSGCPMNVGDLLGSGTISGPGRDACGSLLEISRNGQQPLTIAGGVTRRFLEDGDTVTLGGHAQGAGYRIGFGECRGTLLPALAPPRARPGDPA